MQQPCTASHWSGLSRPPLLTMTGAQEGMSCTQGKHCQSFLNLLHPILLLAGCTLISNQLPCLLQRSGLLQDTVERSSASDAQQLCPASGLALSNMSPELSCADSCLLCRFAQL